MNNLPNNSKAFRLVITKDGRIMISISQDNSLDIALTKIGENIYEASIAYPKEVEGYEDLKLIWNQDVEDEEDYKEPRSILNTGFPCTLDHILPAYRYELGHMLSKLNNPKVFMVAHPMDECDKELFIGIFYIPVSDEIYERERNRMAGVEPDPL